MVFCYYLIGKKHCFIRVNSFQNHWRKHPNIIPCGINRILMKLITTLSIFVLVVFTSATSTSNIKNSGNTISGKAMQDFAYFRVHRMANDASLNWAITNPDQAAHFIIEKSYDGSYWPSDLENELPANGYATYKHRDNAVYPGYIYYRIKLYQLDGTVITSSTEVLHIVKRK